MPETLLDREGNAIAYLENENRIYGFNGKHIG